MGKSTLSEDAGVVGDGGAIRGHGIRRQNVKATRILGGSRGGVATPTSEGPEPAFRWSRFRPYPLPLGDR